MINKGYATRSMNRVTHILGIEYPIVQAAMSWITDARFVAAVSNAGGMGVLGPHAGHNTRPSGLDEVIQRMRNEIRKVKKLTDKPFALNLMMPEDGQTDKYSKAMLEAALEEGVNTFAVVGTVNRAMMKELKDHNSIVLHRELTPSPEAAKLAEAHGADVIIATGYDEGGWIPQNKIGTFSIVPTLVDAVKIPVLATGGINDVRGVRAAFALGAEGVYVGTRFIASKESPAAESAKQAIVGASASDLLMVSSTQRSTPSKFARELETMYRNGEPSENNEKRISDIGGLLPGMRLGDLDQGINSVNTAIDLITEVKTCKEIVHELMADFIQEKQNKTIRLLLPQWQGGNNPDYFFGAELLAHIVPQSEHSKMIRVPVEKDFEKELPIENGVEGASHLLEQLHETTTILEMENPDKVIVLGGDCSISQAPFDYLNRRYEGNLGVLWLDAHPDVATVKDSTRAHEMVLGNLLGHSAPQFVDNVKHPIKRSHVMFAGLKYEELRPRDQNVNQLGLRYATPSDLKENSLPISEWIKENQIKQIAVHFDLDVLSPEDFRSIYPAEPYLNEFGAAVGEMTLEQVVRILTDVSKDAELVGLSIAEHMPWDAMNLRKALSKISIFND